MNQESEVLVRVDGVSKKFCRDLKKSLWYGMKDVASELLPFGKKGAGIKGPESEENREALSNHSKLNIQNSKFSSELRSGEFWAVKDVSFELRRGECLGLIGHNGAGKTTLLKMLNGLIKPDEGTIEMHGRVGALIALGAGFNPILTGRENVYIAGSVLGLTKKEIAAKYEAIVEFAELHEFMDSPVRNFSSGMQVRLGFAIASSLEPDVLLIDEVLAVGDVSFRVKCMNRLREILPHCAVVFVSHSMPQITAISNRVIAMANGKVMVSTPDTGEGIEYYFRQQDKGDFTIVGDGRAKLTQISVNGVFAGDDESIPKIQSGDKLEIKFDLDVNKSIKRVRIRIGIYNIEQRLIALLGSNQGDFEIENKNGECSVLSKTETVFFNNGKFSIHLHVFDVLTSKCLLRVTGAATFISKANFAFGAEICLPCQWDDLSEAIG